MLPRTLNVHVPWSALAPLLELPRAGGSLPCRTVCPRCRRDRLAVFEDTITGGEWHHCGGCGQRGDMIELAAAAWQVPVAAALRRLVERNVLAEDPAPAAVDRYREMHLDRRGRVDAYWEACRAQLPGMAALAPLRARLRLASALPPARWRAGPGRGLGASTAAATAQALTPDRSKPCGRAAGLFRGRGWGEVLVVPYHLAPGRIVGFQFAGREVGPDDRPYWTYDRATARSPVEGGLAGLWSTEDDRGRFAPYAFAVADPFFALRLQVRHFAASTVPLPLVSWWDAAGARTRDAWYALERRQVVFWGWELTPALVYQAMLVDGLISLIPLAEATPRAVDHYVRLAAPADLLRRAIRRARPWKDAIGRWSQEREPGAVEALLVGLERYRGLDLGPVKRALRVEARHVPQRALARVGAVTVHERPDGWYTVHADRKRSAHTLLCEATLRIDRVLTGPDPEYAGRVRFRGDEAEFRCPMAALDVRSVQSWDNVVRLCVELGLGRPLLGPATRAATPAAVALAFADPVTMTVPGPT